MNSQNPVVDLFMEPARALLDRGVERSTTAAALCERLEGKTFAIQTGNTALDVYFVVSDGRLLLKTGAPESSSAGLRGTPLNLARLAGADPEAVIREGHVKITGDADIAAEYRELLDLVRPDWEEELAQFAGDAFAHEAGRAVRGFAGWAARARHSLGRSLAEYLTEESRDLVATAELEEFYAGVDEVSAGVDRLAAKIRRLSDQRSAN